MKITPETAANVLYHFGQGGYEAGSFTTKLMSAIGHADMHNLDQLALGFPELVAAMRLAMHTESGIDALKSILVGADVDVAALLRQNHERLMAMLGEALS